MDIHKLFARCLRVLWRLSAWSLPKRYHLPVRYHIHLWEDCERELRHLQEIGPGTGMAIDVGANRGVYTYALSRLYDRVIAFEANPHLLNMLYAYEGENIDVIPKGLSSSTGQRTLYTPVVRNERLTGWATVNPEIYPQVKQFEEQSVEVTTLDSFHLDGVGFMKIDVEGHEPQVLEGARETIRRCRPHVLVELKPEHLEQVTDFFSAFSYVGRRLHQITDAQSSGNNVIFSPLPRTTP
ncbi:MAG: FkbM family methyltransferase [Bacteroidetes bacterium]|nr:FkbM family methyltransferase [Bacteroidota bacterium]